MVHIKPSPKSYKFIFAKFKLERVFISADPVLWAQAVFALTKQLLVLDISDFGAEPKSD